MNEYRKNNWDGGGSLEAYKQVKTKTCKNGRHEREFEVVRHKIGSNDVHIMWRFHNKHDTQLKRIVTRMILKDYKPTIYQTVTIESKKTKEIVLVVSFETFDNVISKEYTKYINSLKQ